MKNQKNGMENIEFIEKNSVYHKKISIYVHNNIIKVPSITKLELKEFLKKYVCIIICVRSETIK